MINGYNKKKTDRALDMKNESIMTEFLKDTVIWKDLGTPDVCKWDEGDGKEAQLNGIDYLSKKYGNIDAKLITTYNFYTFSQELGFIDCRNHWQPGWLLKENKTDKYLYLYAEVEGYETDYKEAKKHFNKNKITKLKAILVDSDVLKAELHKTFPKNFKWYSQEIYRKHYNHYKELNQIRVDENLEIVEKPKVTQKPYIACSWGGAFNDKTNKKEPFLYERPVNIIISIKTLEKIADKVWDLRF